MQMPWEIKTPIKLAPGIYQRMLRTRDYASKAEAGRALAQAMGLVVPDAPLGCAGSRNAYYRRLRLFHVQRGRCYWCTKTMELEPWVPNIHGKPKHNKKYATFEHLIPKYRGGLNSINNLVLAHGDCNNRRARKKWPHDPVYGKGGPPVIEMDWT